MVGTIILIILALLVIIMVIMGFKIVQQSETMIIERLGRFHRQLDSGINIIWPIIDRPREITWRYAFEDLAGRKRVQFRTRTRIDLREIVYDFPGQNVITRDNVGLEINALLYFQIISARDAIYEIENLPNAIEKLTQTTLRNVIGELDLDQTLTSREVINSKLRIVLDEATGKWGVKVNRVELQDIIPPQDIRNAMEKQMRAERDKRARVLEAEGLKEAQILEAEGVRESQIRRAEGSRDATVLTATGEAEARIRVAEAEAEAINRIAAAVKGADADPTQYLIAIRYIETLREMVSGENNKIVYMPYEATSVLGSLGSMRELLVGKEK